MVYHTIAFRLNAQGVTDAEALVVPDDVITRSGDTRFIVLGGFDRIHRLYAAGPLLREVKIFTPSLETRKLILRALALNSGSKAFDLATRPLNVYSPPISLVASEELSAKVTLASAANPDNHYILLDLGPETIPPAPAGERRWIKLTGSTPLRPGEWTSVRLTPEYQLDVGTYTLTNYIAVSPNLVAVRPILRGQLPRPGRVGIAGTEDTVRKYFARILSLFPSMALGTFTHLSIPEFQLLSDAADTSQVIYIEIVKTG